MTCPSSFLTRQTAMPEGGGGAGPPSGWNTKRRFLAAERTQESGGDYLIVNSSSGALGAYQVMPANLPGWLAQSGQPDMSADAYLHCDSCQDRLAWVILGGYYDRYGPAGAAAMWYSGQPDPHATFGSPPVYQYVDDVLALMHDPGLKPGPGSGGPLPRIRLPSVNIQPELRAMAQVAKQFAYIDQSFTAYARRHRTSVPGRKW